MSEPIVPNRSREKGDRVEREIVNLHKEMGIKAERVPLSGATAYQGNGADLDIYPFGPDSGALVCEVKAAKGIRTGYGRVRANLADNDALFIKEDRREIMVVVPWRVWCRLLAVTKRGQ